MTTWIGLEGIMLSEISQTQKDKHCMILLICGILKKKKPHRKTEQICGCQRLEVGVGELCEGGQKF